MSIEKFWGFRNGFPATENWKSSGPAQDVAGQMSEFGTTESVFDFLSLGFTFRPIALDVFACQKMQIVKRLLRVQDTEAVWGMPKYASAYQRSL